MPLSFNNMPLPSNNMPLPSNKGTLLSNNRALFAESNLTAEVVFIPTLGTKYSHLGNKIFPVWE